MPTLVFDCETTGFLSSPEARPIQLGWVVLDDTGKEQEAHEFLMKTVDNIPAKATEIHGIDTKTLLEKGLDPKNILITFGVATDRIQKGGGRIVAHNADFDVNMLRRVYRDYDIEQYMNVSNANVFCTMKESTAWCKLRPIRYNKYKWPKLQELADTLGIEYDLSALHGARADARLTGRAYMAGVESKWWVLASPSAGKDDGSREGGGA